MPNYVQLEFQITTFIIAILYKFFGYNYIFARAVPLCFYGFMYIFISYRKNVLFKRTSLYCFSNLWNTTDKYIFSRAIMPESAALFLFSCILLFLKWIKEEEKANISFCSFYGPIYISKDTNHIYWNSYVNYGHKKI